MATLEEQFHTRLDGFMDETGMAPTTLGMLAVGDPNLLREIARGRSVSLRTADRALAFMDRYELDAGAAEGPPARRRGPRPAARARGTPRSEAMREQPSDERTKPPVRLLRISEVQARTSLGRSTIYRWSADGRFPAPVMLGGRVARWVEAEGEEWLREWLDEPGPERPGRNTQPNSKEESE